VNAMALATASYSRDAGPPTRPIGTETRGAAGAIRPGPCRHRPRFARRSGLGSDPPTRAASPADDGMGSVASTHTLDFW
jgi:hypothetical protein